MKRLLLVLVAAVVFLAACGESSEGDASADLPGSADSNDATSGNGDQDDSNGTTTDSDDGAESSEELPDDEDAAEIVGNPDLDLDELAEIDPDTAEALDAIDDIVSIGDCESDTVGLAMTAVPDGWQCRVMDQAIGGLDGFTLFMPGEPAGIEITLSTPSPFGPPCEILGGCDQAVGIDLGPNFDIEVVDFGVPIVYGTHKTVDAEVAIVTFQALTTEDIAFITTVLSGVVEI